MSDVIKEIVQCRLSPEERETIALISKHDGQEICEVETSIRKDYNKLMRKGWKLVKIQETAKGDFVSAEFEAPAKYLSFRTVN